MFRSSPVDLQPIIFRKEHKRSYFAGQFFKFVQENKLCEGDICVFELMKGAKRVTMTVHVIRKVHDRFVLVR
nr:unnamed protein product [Digitaria exilis]